MVLANETAKQGLQDVAANNGETLDETHISSNGVSPHSMQSNRLLTTTSAYDREYGGAPLVNNTAQSDSFHIELAPTSDFSMASGVLPYWSQTDRLELAAQKLELAKWEYHRLEENIALNKTNGSDDAQIRQDFLMGRIRDGLTNFGMRQDLITAAMTILQANQNGPASERTAVFPILPLDSEKLGALSSSGLVLPSQEVSVIFAPLNLVD